MGWRRGWGLEEEMWILGGSCDGMGGLCCLQFWLGRKGSRRLVRLVECEGRGVVVG